MDKFLKTYNIPKAFSFQCMTELTTNKTKQQQKKNIQHYKTKLQ